MDRLEILNWHKKAHKQRVKLESYYGLTLEKLVKDFNTTFTPSLLRRIKSIFPTNIGKDSWDSFNEFFTDFGKLQKWMDKLDKISFQLGVNWTTQSLANIDNLLKTSIGLDLGPVFEHAVMTNQEYVKKIFKDNLDKLENKIYESWAQGLRYEQVIPVIMQQNDVSERKARFIARDQTAKINSVLNEARQTQLGIDGYIWMGIGDIRERDSHRLLNWTKQKWSTPPLVGHPGIDYNCRCSAVPDI